MEDTQTLLMMVLKRHFRERPQVLDEALCVIKEYSNKDSVQSEYEKTLHTLRDKMHDLPADILQYFLSMVPLPKQCKENYTSPLADDMKNFEHQSIDSIRPKLVEYLNTKISPLLTTKKEDTNLKNGKHSETAETNRPNETFVQPKKILQAKRRTGKCIQKDCKSLLDICAENVIKNKVFLNQYYKHKNEKVWRLVNSNKYTNDQLSALYQVIEDVNKKAKLMRMIDCDEMVGEILYEEYGNSDILLKERNMYESVHDNPFEISQELRDAIINFVCS